MLISGEGLKLLNNGIVFHECETYPELDKLLDVFAKLRLSETEDPAEDGPEIEIIQTGILFRREGI